MVRDKGFVLFWDGIFSQWKIHEMTIDGVTYNCCEQYMMAEKARLFGDEETLALIMEAKMPNDQKRLGRKVKNFDKTIWEQHDEEIVYRGNKAKFSDPKLKEYLMSFGDDIFVEASPVDKIWGIGLSEKDPRALDPTQWQGLNKLGKAITRVRDEFRTSFVMK